MKYLTAIFLALVTIDGAAAFGLSKDFAMFEQGEGQTTQSQNGKLPCGGSIPITSREKEEIAPIIKERKEHYNAGSRRWSRLYQATLYGSALFSALAALVLKMEVFKKGRVQRYQNDLAAGLATLSALLIAVNTAGQLQKRWLTDRTAVNDVRRLEVEITNPCVTGDEIRRKFNEIVAKQSSGAQ